MNVRMGIGAVLRGFLGLFMLIIDWLLDLLRSLMGKNRDEKLNYGRSTYFFRRLAKLSRQGHPVPDAVPYPGDPLRAVIRNQLLVELNEPFVERTAPLYLIGTDVRDRSQKKQVEVRVKRVSHCNPKLILFEGVEGEELHALTNDVEALYSPEEDRPPPKVKSSSANDIRYSPEEDHPPPKVKSSSGGGGLLVDYEPVSLDAQIKRIRDQAADWKIYPIVAVMDTGIDFAYPKTKDIPIQYNEGRLMCGALEPDYIGWDFVHDQNYPYDDDWHNKHGSRIAAIISHVLHGRVRILPLKVIDKEGFGTLFNIFCAFEYLLQLSDTALPKVVNASWGFYSQTGNNPQLTSYIQRLHQRGVWFVNAAGNRGDVNKGATVSLNINQRWPACDSKLEFNVLTVTTVSQSQATYQVVENYSADFVNAGVGSGPDGKFSEPLVDKNLPPVKGSSYATPFVSAFAALRYVKPNDLATRDELLRKMPDEDEIKELIPVIQDGVIVKVE